MMIRTILMQNINTTRRPILKVRRITTKKIYQALYHTVHTSMKVRSSEIGDIRWSHNKPKPFLYPLVKRKRIHKTLYQEESSSIDPNASKSQQVLTKLQVCEGIIPFCQ